MSERYIRKNKNSYSIVKNSRTYAKISGLDDAVFIRDFLAENNWDVEKIPQTIKKDDNYLILSVFDEKIYLIAKYREKPSEKTISSIVKKHRRNPNNSKYGLNITKVFDTFVIKKQIFNDDYIFGYYDRLEDAQFVRNFLMDNQWNVNQFSEIEFDDETDMYNVVSIIDDKVYILDSFKTPEINLDEVHEEFLGKIAKHKHGLASYPHLELLKDKIDELESRFGVKANDEVWSFDEVSSPLNDIIFKLTPFQTAVYESILDSASLEKIEKSLIRYKSGNFTNKIQKNLDELIELKLIEKVDDNTYKKL